MANQALQVEIAERKNAQEALKSVNQDLTHTVSQLKAANKEIESFWFSISHDLQAPLRGIESFSHIIVEDYAEKLDEEGREALALIRNNTRSLGQLINDLLAFSQLGYQEKRFVKIDMAGMAGQVFSEHRQAVPDRVLEFHMGELPPAIDDPILLRQVFASLMANAIKYTRSKECAIIEVEGLDNGDEHIYTIRDNGVGFNMKCACKLFGVFQRMHNRDEFEGTGVGLASVQRIVHRHGGRVWAAGKVSEGASFYFALPSCSNTATV